MLLDFPPFLHILLSTLLGLLLLFWRETAGSMRSLSGSGFPLVGFLRVNALSRNAGALSWWAMPLWSWRTCLHVTYTPHSRHRVGGVWGGGSLVWGSCAAGQHRVHVGQHLHLAEAAICSMRQCHV